MPATAALSNRIPQLDGLRGCAVAAVFLSHAFHIRMLWIGVDLFFVMSGFLITGILLDLKHLDMRQYFRHFYARRLRRLLIPYLMLLVVVAIVFDTSWLRHWYMYFGLMNYTEFFGCEKYLPLNPLWSLGVEEQFYLFWPLAVFALSIRRLRWLIVVLLMLAPVLRVVAIPYDPCHWLVYKGLPFRMDLLAMGALLALVWRSHRGTIERFGYLGLLPLIVTPPLMIVLSHHGLYSTQDGTIQGNLITYEIALAAVTGAFLWALGGRFVQPLTLAPLRFLGRISYTFYLIHLPAILFMDRYTERDGVIAGAALLFSLAYATASWFLIERPMLRGIVSADD